MNSEDKFQFPVNDIAEIPGEAGKIARALDSFIVQTFNLVDIAVSRILSDMGLALSVHPLGQRFFMAKRTFDSGYKEDGNTPEMHWKWSFYWVVRLWSKESLLPWDQFEKHMFITHSFYHGEAINALVYDASFTVRPVDRIVRGFQYSAWTVCRDQPKFERVDFTTNGYALTLNETSFQNLVLGAVATIQRNEQRRVAAAYYCDLPKFNSND